MFKKILLLVTVSFFYINSFSQMTIGFGLGVLRQQRESFNRALNINGGIYLIKNISIETSYSYAKAEGWTVYPEKYNELNFDILYHQKNISKVFKPYLFVGINYSEINTLEYIQIEYEDEWTMDYTIIPKYKYGVNLGVGIMLITNKKINPFLQYKRIIINHFQQSEILLGIKYHIKI